MYITFNQFKTRGGLMELAWINFLRVVATFAVVLLHTTSPVIVFSNDPASYGWWAANGINASMRWCVPIFVMVSGALLLEPRAAESTARFYAKRARRVLVPILFWSLVYLMIPAVKGQLTLKTVLALLLRGEPHYHLWFLYMILGLYAITPLLRTYVKSASTTQTGYLILAIFVIGGIIGLLNNIGFINTNSVFTRFIPYIGYFLCGYHLKKAGQFKMGSYLLAGVIIAASLLTAAGTGCMVIHYQVERGWRFFYDYFSPAVILSSLGVFLLARDRLKMHRAIAAAVEWITPTTFGIYLLHPLILMLLARKLQLSPENLGGVFTIFGVAAITFLLCYLVVSVVKKVPIIGRWIL